MKDHKRITLDDKVTFLQQFAALVSSGTPLPQAIGITAQQSRSVKMRRILEEIAARVAGGCPIGSVLADYRGVFEDRWIKLIGMGEASGKLDIVLSDLSNRVRESCEARRKMARAFARPIGLLSAAVLIVAVMVWFVKPTVVKMFNQIASQLPETTPSLLSSTIESISGSDPIRQLLEASAAASGGIAGHGGPASGTNSEDGLSSLTLNATYIQGNRRLALIDGQVYEQGESLAISDSMPGPCIVARISADKVLIRHRDQTVELKYGSPAFSHDSPCGVAEIEEDDLKLDLLPSVLLQLEETSHGL